MRFNTLIIAATLFSATAGATDFKGIELDNVYSNESIQAKAGYQLPLNLGNSISCLTPTFCSGKVKLADGTATATFWQNQDGSIGSIDVMMYSQDFPAVESMLKAKYGAPTTVSHHALQNAFGAKISSTFDTWKRPNGDVITLIEHFDMEDGSFTLSSAKFLKHTAESRATQAKQGQI